MLARTSLLAVAAIAARAADDLPYFGGVTDTGIVMPFGGDCPGDCDEYGARDTWLFYDPQDPLYPYKFTYDGSGPNAWLSALAVSNDPTLRNWTKKGYITHLGPQGSKDSASASYLTTNFINGQWVGYYLATPTVSPPPGRVPIAPYYSMAALAPTAYGPWTQLDQGGYSIFPEGSPGPIFLNPNDPTGTEWWQFCTGCGASIGAVKTTNLTGNWTQIANLITDPVENVSLYYEESNGLWFLFTNHVGPDQLGMMFDDAIWVYWSNNLLNWPLDQKAVVLNRTNVIEPSFQVGRVGLPSVMRVPGNDTHLAMLYDGGGTRDNVSYNENCSVALAWLTLPLTPPAASNRGEKMKQTQ
jgi:hypothetical protein